VSEHVSEMGRGNGGGDRPGLELNVIQIVCLKASTGQIDRSLQVGHTPDSCLEKPTSESLVAETCSSEGL